MSEKRTIEGPHALVYSVCQLARHYENDFASSITFGDEGAEAGTVSSVAPSPASSSSYGEPPRRGSPRVAGLVVYPPARAIRPGGVVRHDLPRREAVMRRADVSRPTLPDGRRYRAGT